MARQRRFLIASWAGGGNTPPAFNLGTRLVRRGHRVRIAGWPSMAQQAAAAEVEFAPYRSMRPWPEELSLDDGWEDVKRLLRGAATRDDIVAEAHAFGADALVVDCMMGAAFAARARLGLPTAVLTHVLYSAYASGWGDELLEGNMDELFGATNGVLALTAPGFDSPVRLPSNTAYVGPIAHPDSGRRSGLRLAEDLRMLERPGDPWVLLSMSSTLQGQAEALSGILAALEPLRVRVLLTLGGVVPIDAIAAPPNVTVRAYVPHDMVLPHMAAVITHAGLSTITAALEAGLPIVCIPQGRDQHLNAARAEACGAGRLVDAAATATELAGAVDAVLRDGAFRSAAKRLADEIAALGHGELATDRVERIGLAPPVGVEPTTVELEARCSIR
jgi:UDP:flavonoid glycosyltransferase YjiC (YdhE family)